MWTSNEVTTYVYPILSRLHEIGGKPNRQHILRTTQELTVNAGSAVSLYGDHGHTFLTMSPKDYQVLNGGVAFVMPVQPVPNPDIVAGATAAAIAEAVRQHVPPTAKTLYQCASPSPRWSTHNRQPTCEATTAQLSELPTVRLSSADPKQ
jgi:hypothetical protein